MPMATALATMYEEADALCGGRYARDPERTHMRGGTESVVMGGHRLPSRRPQVHAVGDGGRGREVQLATTGCSPVARARRHNTRCTAATASGNPSSVAGIDRLEAAELRRLRRYRCEQRPLRLPVLWGEMHVS